MVDGSFQCAARCILSIVLAATGCTVPAAHLDASRSDTAPTDAATDAATQDPTTTRDASTDAGGVRDDGSQAETGPDAAASADTGPDANVCFGGPTVNALVFCERFFDAICERAIACCTATPGGCTGTLTSLATCRRDPVYSWLDCSTSGFAGRSTCAGYPDACADAIALMPCSQILGLVGPTPGVCNVPLF